MKATDQTPVVCLPYARESATGTAVLALRTISTVEANEWQQTTFYQEYTSERSAAKLASFKGNSRT